ncbi:YoaK family protein [Lacinutrix gracilariae]|uniref:YoaK family protein n=1 Tax=Lacinutrix gracilariae TaxID=1747198 RepID=A0ABW5JZI9_9FLAO
MFRHQGKSRTLKHNLKIATILSFVAGIVNVTGYLAFKQLTTNVTGHFALFISDVANFDFWIGTIYFLYIFSFLFGSFVSGFLIEKYRENKKLNVFVVPTIIECVILISIATFSNFMEIKYPDAVVCLLLFAMGLQNSFVTKISNAIVRTTHLTGLFTDLGIELSQLFFPQSFPQKEKLKSTIKLRIYIICFFFLGGLTGGFLYSRIGLKLNTLTIGAIILFISLIFDDLRYGLIRTKRKYRKKTTHKTP